MKDLVFLFDDPEERFATPLKIGNSLLNRFTIDEEASFEILGIHYMTKLENETTDEIRAKNNRFFENEFLQKEKEMSYRDLIGLRELTFLYKIAHLSHFIQRRG